MVLPVERASRLPDWTHLLTAAGKVPLQDRLCAVFLGADVEPAFWHLRKVAALAMMSCLDAFAVAQGGRVVYAARLDQDTGPRPPQHLDVRLGGVMHKVMVEGNCFIELADERVWVAVDEIRHDGTYAIQIRSDRRDSDFRRRWERFTSEHSAMRGRTLYADGQEVPRTREYGWDDIVLAPEVREGIARHVERFLSRQDRVQALGMKSRRGVLLEGPPGTGKTLLGKVLSSVLPATFLWVQPQHVDDRRCFVDIYDTARLLAPTVVFLEDLDLFAGDRDDRLSSVLGPLMNQLDGAGDTGAVVTIATTNRLELVENALRNRPGRFDLTLHLGPPDRAARRKMLTQLLAPLNPTTELLDQATDHSEDFTGAQVEELANGLLLETLEGGSDLDLTLSAVVSPSAPKRHSSKIGFSR